MANEENLIPASQRSKSEARENSKKGGVASGKSRRRKKALHLALKGLMDMPLGELAPDLRDGIMIAAKVTDDGLTVADAVIGSIVRTACNGNSQMAKLLLDTIEESADIRIKRRELRLKEKVLDGGQMDSTVNVTITSKEARDSENRQGD